MVNIITVDDLKKEAVRVYNGMITVFPQFYEEKALDVSELVPKFNTCYARNNSTVCFVSDNEVFVTPCTRSTMLSLRLAGFSEKYFYVPFSNGDYPKIEKAKWNTLKEKAGQSYKDDFIDDCIAYCNEHNIGAISDETLSNCLEIPETGVKVKKFGFEAVYYPVIRSKCFDSTVVDNIGRFSKNNGKVVFIYRNGKIYVTKGYKIVNELRDAGYKEADIFVPFSNGEDILDKSLKARWESIEKC